MYALTLNVNSKILKGKYNIDGGLGAVKIYDFMENLGYNWIIGGFYVPKDNNRSLTKTTEILTTIKNTDWFCDSLNNITIVDIVSYIDLEEITDNGKPVKNRLEDMINHAHDLN